MTEPLSDEEPIAICICQPDGPFCGACAYDEDGELIEAQAHAR